MAKACPLEKYDKVFGAHDIICKREDENIKWVNMYPLFKEPHTSNGTKYTWIMFGCSIR